MRDDGGWGGVEGVMMIYTEWLGVRVRKCWLLMGVAGVMGGGSDDE